MCFLQKIKKKGFYCLLLRVCCLELCVFPLVKPMKEKWIILLFKLADNVKIYLTAVLKICRFTH